MQKIIVRGPALSQSGYGVQTRFALQALRKFPNRFDVYLINTPWGNTGWCWEDTEERRWIDNIIQKTIQYQQSGGKYDISVQVCIPNEWQKMAPINIGYTAGIETTKISFPWFEGAFRVNKIILTSNHAKFAFDNTIYNVTNNNTGQQFNAKIDIPLKVVGYPVNVVKPKEIDLELSNDFNFITVAQWGPRKNLDNTIKWFVEEFKDKKVGLIVKTQTMNNSLMDRQYTQQRLKMILKNYPDKICSVHLLHGDLTTEEMAYVYQHPKIKALISLTHGEGFGLPIFESVYNGLPVIAPAWGGQNDFIFMPNSKDKKNKCMVTNVSYDIKNVQSEAVIPDMIIPESQWCFPKEFHAKIQMKEVYKNYQVAKSKALKLQEYILQEFATDKMLTEFANAVCEDIPVVDISRFLNDNISINPLLEQVEKFE